MIRGTNWLMKIVMVCAVVGAIYLFLLAPQYIKKFFPQKSINVLAWPAVIDSSEFEKFERETGIKVYLTYFEDYEELIVKMNSGPGDYDLIMTSDYAVQTLLKNNVVKPIDKTKLTFWNDLYKPLLNLYCDPDNKHTIPFAWEIYGIGINKDYFKGIKPTPSWSILFEKGQSPTNVGMLDDVREVISVAALYLFGKDHDKKLTHDEINQIKQLLIKQKPWVAMYNDLSTDYLLISDTSAVVMGLSSDIYQAMREYDNIDFIIPREGGFILVDHFVIPATCTNDDLVYQFLNFLYRPDVMSVYASRYYFFPVRTGVMGKKDHHMIRPTESLLSQLSFFNYQIPQEAVRSVWIALKS